LQCQLDAKEAKASKECKLEANCYRYELCVQRLCPAIVPEECDTCLAQEFCPKCELIWKKCEKVCAGIFNDCVDECERPEREKCPDTCRNEADSRILHRLLFLLNDKLIYESHLQFGSQINKIRV
jgi:hypothetical protein